MPYNRFYYHWIRIRDHVDERWKNFETFHNDVANTMPHNSSIDRPNRTKPFSLTNHIFIAPAHWGATRKAQKLSWKGKTQSIKAWAIDLDLYPELIRGRLRMGWTIEKTLSTKGRK